MPSLHDAQSFLQLGRYSDALISIQEIKSRRTLQPNEEVMLAELLVLTGDLESAIATAQQLLKQRALSLKQRCRVRHTLGMCFFRNGHKSRGIDHYQAGIGLAEDSNDFLEECRLRVQFFADQVRWLGPQAAAVGLVTLRRKIHQLADPVVALTFQLALAELAAKLALLPRARKHLETARSLLKSVPNEETHLSFRRSEIALSSQEGNYSEALHSALELAEAIQPSAFLYTTLSHLLITQSKFDEAEKWLARGLGDPRLAGVRGVTLRDTMMYLRVCQGRFDDAGLLSASIDHLLEESQGSESFFGLWYLSTKVKWLYRSQRVNEGLCVALDAIPRIERMADRNLLDRMKLLHAEGLALSGQPWQGALVIADVFKLNPDPALELWAEAMRVAGRLASVDSPHAAAAYFDRSLQILRLLGHSAARADVERDRLESLPSVGTGNGRSATASSSERIATLLEMGSHAPLFAAEIFALMVDTGSAHTLTLLGLHPDGQKELMLAYQTPDLQRTDAKDLSEIHVQVGVHREVRYEIAVVPMPTSAARISILAVERLVMSALSLARSKQLEREQAALWPEQTPEQQLGLICSSERMLDLVKTIRRVAATNVTVLLTGETGVGKELFARALHQASPRSDKVFLPFNCATVPREMFDSQLFGHRRGSFTGAIDDAAGVIRSAAGGTLFLDEIGEMSPDSQPKLLRFLESGEIRPLGDAKPQLVDVRIVAATNANLDQLIADGRFREDLYYRLNVIRINIPPLRDRREEIPALVEHFLERYGREFEKPQLRVADETLEYLVLYRWPGNVRQLSNEMRRIVALAEPGAVLMPAHLSDDIAASRMTIPTARPALHSTEVLTRLDQPLAAAVDHIERAAIQRAVSVAEGNLLEAAKMLGLSRKGLYLKRQRLGLE